MVFILSFLLFAIPGFAQERCDPLAIDSKISGDNELIYLVAKKDLQLDAINSGTTLSSTWANKSLSLKVDGCTIYGGTSTDMQFIESTKYSIEKHIQSLPGSHIVIDVSGLRTDEGGLRTLDYDKQSRLRSAVDYRNELAAKLTKINQVLSK